MRETWFAHLLFSKDFIDLHTDSEERRREMNVSGQVMVTTFAGHALSLHSLVSIITHQKNCCLGVRSYSRVIYGFRDLISTQSRVNVIKLVESICSCAS